MQVMQGLSLQEISRALKISKQPPSPAYIGRVNDFTRACDRGKICGSSHGARFAAENQSLNSWSATLVGHLEKFFATMR
jgi:hypothetical protein